MGLGLFLYSASDARFWHSFSDASWHIEMPGYLYGMLLDAFDFPNLWQGLLQLMSKSRVELKNSVPSM